MVSTMPCRLLAEADTDIADVVSDHISMPWSRKHVPRNRSAKRAAMVSQGMLIDEVRLFQWVGDRVVSALFHLATDRVASALFPRFTWVVTARPCSAGLLGLPRPARVAALKGCATSDTSESRCKAEATKGQWRRLATYAAPKPGPPCPPSAQARNTREATRS
jgi:hypothetical protein